LEVDLRKNKIKQVMESDQLALGAYVGLADPQIVEIIGIAGFDAAFIDMEHTAFDLSIVQQMIIAAVCSMSMKAASKPAIPIISTIWGSARPT
jgi:2-keto-3-deoxy-L-rhamnonate aldolase RhmA